jgi:cytoskeleton-associated protein 5
LEAYQEITSQFQKSPSEDDPVFKPFLSSPDLFKKIVTDTNVVAQESGIAALCAFLEYGGTQACIRLRNHVVAGLCEKGLSSSRAGTKTKTIEALMWLVELDTPDPVVEAMLPSLSARLPKLVAGTVKALHEIYSEFGAQTVNPKLVLPSLPKLFSHADRTVRSETSNLTVELHIWMGPALQQILFTELKPVQQKDLTGAFERVKDQKPVQKRYLKSQREAMEAAQEIGASNGDVGDSDVVMSNTEESTPVDPYDMVDFVDVLSKLPSDLATRVTASKWKDRVEVLTEAHKEMNVLKYADSDYQELVRMLAKCIRDVNIQVVSLAANCIEVMAKGLRKRFQRYALIVLGPLLERCKEKKPSVLEALNGALDAVFESSSFSEVLPDTLEAMKHKTPQVRLAACQFLIKILKNTLVSPNKSEVEEIIASSVKLVGDTLPDVRTCGFEAVGTLMKITGERELNSYLDSIDDLKMKKIKEFYEKAEVKTKLSKAKPVSAAPSTTGRSTASKPGISKASSIKRKSMVGKPAGSMSSTAPSLGSTTLKKVGSTIPSKRGPTSPLKSDVSTSRIGVFGKSGLTGRSLQSSSSTSHLSSHSAATPNPNKDNGLSDAERAELEQLRLDKQQWLEEKEKQGWKVEEAFAESSKLMREIQTLTSKVDKLNDQHTSDAMAIKSKETQLQRAQSDLEIARLKISQLENEIELIQKQKSTSFNTFSLESPLPPFEPRSYPLQESNATRGSVLKSIDGLDQRVSGLSIDSEQKENGLNRATLDTTDESWRRAAEVTSQLKARIEKMKAKSRAASQRGV